MIHLIELNHRKEIKNLFREILIKDSRKKEREKEMKKFEEIINERKDIEIQNIRFNEDENIHIMNNSQYERFINYLNENFKDEFEIKEDENKISFREKKNHSNMIQIKNESQIHISRDKDIKIISRKRDSDSHNFKLIYHRDKDNKKEYRIFESFRDENNKLKRIRLRNSEIKKIEKNEEKMRKYFDSLFEEKKEKKII